MTCYCCAVAGRWNERWYLLSQSLASLPCVLRHAGSDVGRFWIDCQRFQGSYNEEGKPGDYLKDG